MTSILADAEMVKQIAAADGPVNVVDAKGTVIGVVTPIKFPRSPYSPEQIEQRREALKAVREEVRSHPERGKTLAEFWKEMEQLHGKQS